MRLTKRLFQEDLITVEEFDDIRQTIISELKHGHQIIRGPNSALQTPCTPKHHSSLNGASHTSYSPGRRSSLTQTRNGERDPWETGHRFHTDQMSARHDIRPTAPMPIPDPVSTRMSKPASTPPNLANDEFAGPSATSSLSQDCFGVARSPQ